MSGSDGLAGGIIIGNLAAPEPLPFKRVLVANRGEIARRIFRTATTRGLQSVAVFSEPDRGAAHVRDADIAVALGGNTSAESYLVVDKILDAARKSGADAIHPGYGFLSENPKFAQAVVDAGLTWIGPTPDSIRAMALKIEAKRLAEAAGVPLVPGAEIDADAPEPKLISTASKVGFPLLVKASAGGGGKGMRIVADATEVLEAVTAARREAESSFGDPTVFFERYLTGARHVEVQVFGDAQGNVVHLFERECSIQRRHQKIIEESPSPGTTDKTLKKMYAAAVSLTKEIGYVGAGTVEFLVAGEGKGQEFFFLEMNTRLQVEHPVTESVTGLDLVDWQFEVAAGHDLPLSQDRISRSGHAIEARLYAEDPANGYLPSTGLLAAFKSPRSGADSASTREDSSVETGDEITPYYDPMISKIISWEGTRELAAKVLADDLRNREIAGVTTNRALLVAILESEEFLAGTTPTSFLEDNPSLAAADPVPASGRRKAAMNAAICLAMTAASDSPWRQTIPIGWRNVAAVPQRQVLEFETAGQAETLNVDIEWRSPDEGLVTVTLVDPLGGISEPAVEFRVPGGLARDSYDGFDFPLEVQFDGVTRSVHVGCDQGWIWVSDSVDSITFKIPPRFDDPSAHAGGGGPSAPVPGTVVSVEVAAGDVVTEGQTLVVLEAMKMEHKITAAVDGVVDEVLVEVGSSVDAHQVLVTLKSEDLKSEEEASNGAGEKARKKSEEKASNE